MCFHCNKMTLQDSLNDINEPEWKLHNDDARTQACSFYELINSLLFKIVEITKQSVATAAVELICLDNSTSSGQSYLVKNSEVNAKLTNLHLTCFKKKSECMSADVKMTLQLPWIITSVNRFVEESPEIFEDVQSLMSIMMKKQYNQVCFRAQVKNMALGSKPACEVSQSGLKCFL